MSRFEVVPTFGERIVWVTKEWPLSFNTPWTSTVRSITATSKFDNVLNSEAIDPNPHLLTLKNDKSRNLIESIKNFKLASIIFDQSQFVGFLWACFRHSVAQTVMSSITWPLLSWRQFSVRKWCFFYFCNCTVGSTHQVHGCFQAKQELQKRAHHKKLSFEFIIATCFDWKRESELHDSILDESLETYHLPDWMEQVLIPLQSETGKTCPNKEPEW